MANQAHGVSEDSEGGCGIFSLLARRFWRVLYFDIFPLSLAR